MAAPKPNKPNYVTPDAQRRPSVNPYQPAVTVVPAPSTASVAAANASSAAAVEKARQQ
jgi:hypothetical protein